MSETTTPTEPASTPEADIELHEDFDVAKEAFEHAAHEYSRVNDTVSYLEEQGIEVPEALADKQGEAFQELSGLGDWVDYLEQRPYHNTDARLIEPDSKKYTTESKYFDGARAEHYENTQGEKLEDMGYRDLTTLLVSAEKAGDKTKANDANEALMNKLSADVERNGWDIQERVDGEEGSVQQDGYMERIIKMIDDERTRQGVVTESDSDDWKMDKPGEPMKLADRVKRAKESDDAKADAKRKHAFIPDFLTDEYEEGLESDKASSDKDEDASTEKTSTKEDDDDKGLWARALARSRGLTKKAYAALGVGITSGLDKFGSIGEKDKDSTEKDGKRKVAKIALGAFAVGAGAAIAWKLGTDVFRDAADAASNAAPDTLPAGAITPEMAADALSSAGDAASGSGGESLGQAVEVLDLFDGTLESGEWVTHSYVEPLKEAGLNGESYTNAIREVAELLQEKNPGFDFTEMATGKNYDSVVNELTNYELDEIIKRNRK